jgi:ATP-dependent Clp protease protease subunit
MLIFIKINLRRIVILKAYLRNSCHEIEQEEIPIKRNVFSIGSDVYFFDYIDEETFAILIREMNAAKDYLIKSQAPAILELGSLSDTVTLHINCPGGNVIESLAMYDFIQNFPLPVVGIVEGAAASGGSILLCACSYRLMTEHSMILCHELSGGAIGKYSSLVDSHMTNEIFMKHIKNIYKKDTKIPEKELDSLLRHDIYWDADESLKYGLVNSIIGRDVEDEEIKLDSKKKPTKEKPKKLLKKKETTN